MATKTFDELKQLAIQIRDEKTNKQNTATRVGTEMLEHLNKLEQDYYDKTTINNRTSEYNVSLNHPTSGISDGNKYDLSTAIGQVPAELRTAGLTISFLNESGDTEKWEFVGGSWTVGEFTQVGAGRLTELSKRSEIVEAKSGFPFTLSKGFIGSDGNDGEENDLRVRTSPIFDPFEYELNAGIILTGNYYYNLDGTFISQGKPNHSNYYKRLVFGKSDGSNINPIIDEVFKSYSLSTEKSDNETSLRVYLFEPYVNPVFVSNNVNFDFTKIIKEIIPLDDYDNYYKANGNLRKFFVYGIGKQTAEQFIVGIKYEKDDGSYESSGATFVSAEKNTNLWIEVGSTSSLNLRFRLLIDTTWFYKGEVLTYMINPTIENTEFSSIYLENQLVTKKVANNEQDIDNQAAALTSLNSKVSNIESLSETMVYPKNLYNKSKQIEGENGAENGYLDDSGSVVTHATAKVSYYIPVQSGVEYFAQDMYGMATRYCTYGVNRDLKRVVYKGSGTSAPVDDRCMFNSDEAFARFSIRDINKFMFSKSSEKQTYEEGFEPYMKVTEKMLEEISKNLKVGSGLEGLKIVAFGDSITDGKVDSASDSSTRITWVETLAKMIGSRYIHLKATTSSMQSGPYENIVNYDVFNMGSSGMRITYKKDGSTVEEWTDATQIGELGGKNTNNVLYNWFRRFEMLNTRDGKRLIEPDIFIIAAGTNDVSQGSDKGEISDAFDVTANYPNDLDTLDNKKMTSALKRVLLYIQINYPKAKIYYCTPIHGGYGGRTLQALEEVADKNTEVCGYMNVEVIDLFRKSGINGIFENQKHIDSGDTRDTIDGVHVRQSGADKQAKTIFNVCRATY